MVFIYSKSLYRHQWWTDKGDTVTTVRHHQQYAELNPAVSCENKSHNKNISLRKP